MSLEVRAPPAGPRAATEGVGADAQGGRLNHADNRGSPPSRLVKTLATALWQEFGLDFHRCSRYNLDMKRRVTDPGLVDRIAGECIAVRVRLINRVVTAIYDEALRPFGLRVSQANIL